MAKDRKGGSKKKKKERRTVVHGIAHIKATFNNTLICISDLDGNFSPMPAPVDRGSAEVVRAHPLLHRRRLIVPLPLARDQFGMRYCDVRGEGSGFRP